MAAKVEILKELYEKGGHASENNMKFLEFDRYKWKGIIKDIDQYVSKCRICSQAGNERQNTKNRVIKTEKFNEMWEIDLKGRIPMKDGTSKFIFVAIELYSKWIEARVVYTNYKHSIVKFIQELIIDKHDRRTKSYQIIGKNLEILNRKN